MADTILTIPSKKSNQDSPLKKCSACQRLLPRSEFHKNNSAVDKLNYACKECVSARIKAYYRKDPDKFKQRARAYLAKPGKLERFREISEIYRNSERGKESRKKNHRKDKETHGERYLARRAAQKAVARGKLPKAATLACEYRLDGCEIQAREYHHYAGYDKENQLKVKAVCLNCHRLLEGKTRWKVTSV